MGDTRITTGDAMHSAASKLNRELEYALGAADKALEANGMTNLRSATVDPYEALRVAVEAGFWSAWNDGFSTGAGAKYAAEMQRAGIPLHNRGPHPAIDPRSHRLLLEVVLVRLLNEPGELLGFLDRIYAVVKSHHPDDSHGLVNTADLAEILAEAGYPFREDELFPRDPTDDGCPRNDPDCTAPAEACHDACEWPAADAAAIQESTAAAYDKIRSTLGGNR